MPVTEYYKGEGRSVMHKMQRKYGAKAGKRIFYATAEKRGLKPKATKHRRKR